MPKIDKGYEKKYGKAPKESLTGGPGINKSRKSKQDYIDELERRHRPKLIGKRKKLLDEI